MGKQSPSKARLPSGAAVSGILRNDHRFESWFSQAMVTILVFLLAPFLLFTPSRRPKHGTASIAPSLLEFRLIHKWRFSWRGG